MTLAPKLAAAPATVLSCSELFDMTLAPNPTAAAAVDTTVAWPILMVMVTRRLLTSQQPVDLVLSYAEALEEAADHADGLSTPFQSVAHALRQLASVVRLAAPVRDDTAPEKDIPHDPA